MDESKNHRAACFTLWFPDHNNLRYADLFPRLDPIVRFYRIVLSRHRILRGLEYRLWNTVGRKVLGPLLIRYLSRRYPVLFTVDPGQIAAWPTKGSVVVDMDDPVFSPAEVKLLNLPQVKAVVVTTEKARTIFQEMGVARPIYVIPQGVSLKYRDSIKIRAIRLRFRDEGDVVIGYHAPFLTLSRDGARRAREGQDDLDFLFAALEKAREVEPRLRLWLFGRVSESVKDYIADGRASWVKPFGYIPFSEIVNYLSEVDIGVYPRTWSPPPGRFSIKIAQFMACGIPVVANRLDESAILQNADCGIICESQEDFARALIHLAQRAEKRAALGNAGRRYAQTKLDWSILAPTYREILTG